MQSNPQIMKSNHQTKNSKFIIIILFVFTSFNNNIFSQPNYNEILGQDKLNAITTSVPFLLIAPDARGGAMGDVGVASTPDVNSMHYNPAKFAFVEKDFGIAVSYSPWLQGLVNDINLGYLTAYKKIDDEQAIGGSLRYFSLGDIFFTDKQGEPMGQFKPNEFAVDLAYARKFSDKVSGSISFRYINSNLTGGIPVSGAESKVGHSFATDLGFFYTTEIEYDKKPGIFNLGVSVTNIGTKISYTENIDKDFIPINLRIGPSFQFDIDKYNTVGITFDIAKLLVPTPPVYAVDSLGRPVYDADGKYAIEKGKDPDRSVVSGMLGSFNDAPGGLQEELKELNIGVGLEWWYDKQFAIRGGMFYEHAHKGGRKYATLGAGFRMNVFGLDFAYLIPFEQRHPLENTLRFTLSFDFDAFKNLGKN